MALIRNAKGRLDGGYTRLFGNHRLGLLISRVQSAVISSGNELETLVKELIPNKIDDFERFIQKTKFDDGAYLIDKKTIKESVLKIDKEPDFLIFKISSSDKNHCYIIELKDGDNFDTKKAYAEKEQMLKFQNHISKHVPFTTSIHICSFNQNNKDNILVGFKNVFTVEEILTGKELCEILGIDYKLIMDKRKQDQRENTLYFIEEFLSIFDRENRIINRIINKYES